MNNGLSIYAMTLLISSWVSFYPAAFSPIFLKNAHLLFHGSKEIGSIAVEWRCIPSREVGFGEGGASKLVLHGPGRQVTARSSVCVTLVCGCWVFVRGIC